MVHKLKFRRNVISVLIKYHHVLYILILNIYIYIKRLKKYIFSKIKICSIWGWPWSQGGGWNHPKLPGPPPWHLGRKGREMELGEILWWKRREQCIS
jgi:hypothetical protein